MANYTAADVKKLRELTAAGMLDCKNALVEADGDFDKAVEIIRIKGQKGVTKREGRSAQNGLVTGKAVGNLGVLLELNSETDFVAKGERFRALADELLTALADSKIDDLDKFVVSAFAPGKSVADHINEGNAMLGEKIELRRIAVLDGAPAAVYLHRTSPDLPPQVGVLVQLTKAVDKIGTDIAQHIAAFAPQFVSREDVPADLIESERHIAEETARNEGKPEAALSKIVEGRVTGFIKEVSLLEQAFAKDNKKTVKQVLDEAGTQVTAFARFRVGQA
ncbi:MAG TPA: translation elongation factor Ts [Candidatus Nanopelagicaceae bacterium]|nr:translation elongation factor Ts [Candidatus Nanopelagicaceae bacterium]